MGKKLFYYDENDNWVKSVYQTIDGKPALDNTDGTYICENEYDEYGNSIAQYFKTSDGKLMISGMYGCAGVVLEYDEKGFIKKQSTIGIDGNIEIKALSGGYAIAEYKCNEYGFVSDITFMDIDGNPCESILGSAYVKIVTDSRGNELERWNYDLNKELVAATDGYAGYKSEYDSIGNWVRIMYYGEDGKLCEINSGYSGWTREYNEMGDYIKQSYFGTDMKPITDNNNVCSIVAERDIRGNITKIFYYNEKGELTLSGEGLAIIEYEYDDNGNEICRRFFDKNNKPTKGYIGYAKITYTYDDKSNLLSERYYDTKNDLVLVNGIAGNNYKRDNHGNVIEEFPIGLDQKMAKGKLMSRYEFDEKDNPIEFAVFNSDGEPATNSANIHKITQKFNNRNQCIEICYYNTKGELTPYINHNYCIERSEYDEKGQIVKVSYFDKNNKPAIYADIEGEYSSRTIVYDQFGRCIKNFYFDKNGNLTDPNVMVPEAVCDYDKWGNMIYVASCDGKGNLIMNPQSGWSFMRCEYNNRGNLMWVSYFDSKEKPMLGKDGYHKVVYTYTDSDNVHTISYYNTNGAPMLVNNYHKQINKYDDNGMEIENAYYDTNGKPINAKNFFHKVTMKYDKNNIPTERKKFDVNGTQQIHEQFIDGEWIKVRDWKKEVREFFGYILPLDFGEELENLVLYSYKIRNNKVEILMKAPSSKYAMSNEDIGNYIYYTEIVLEHVLKVKLDLPKDVKLTYILEDSKGRELSRSK